MRNPLAVAVATAVLLIGCGVKQVAPPAPPLASVASGQRVLLLPPRLIYTSVTTDREVSGAPYDEAARAQQLEAGVQARLAARGVQLVSVADLSEDARRDAAPIVEDLRARYPRLIGAAKDKTAFRPALAQLHRLSGAELACVPLLNVRVGSDGGYDPNTGQVWKTTSTTSLRLALVTLDGGERRWLREAFLRSVVSRSDLERALDVVFEEH